MQIRFRRSFMCIGSSLIWHVKDRNHMTLRHHYVWVVDWSLRVMIELSSGYVKQNDLRYAWSGAYHKIYYVLPNLLPGDYCWANSLYIGRFSLKCIVRTCVRTRGYEYSKETKFLAVNTAGGTEKNPAPQNWVVGHDGDYVIRALAAYLLKKVLEIISHTHFHSAIARRHSLCTMSCNGTMS